MSELPTTPGSIVAAGGLLAILSMDGEWWPTSPGGWVWRDFQAHWDKHEGFRTIVYVPAAASAVALVERIEAALAKGEA